MSIAPPHLSFAQERLWIIDQLVDDKALYNASMLFNLDGQLKPSLLERSIVEVMRRHAVLRSGFAEHQGVAIAIEAHAESFSLAFEDVRTREQADDWAKQHQHEVTNLPFSLSSPPLLRAVLYRFDENRYQLLLTVHHIIFDGASIDVFLKELEAIYPSLEAGRPVPLRELSMQSADAAAAERLRISGEHRQRLLDRPWCIM